MDYVGQKLAHPTHSRITRLLSVKVGGILVLKTLCQYGDKLYYLISYYFDIHAMKSNITQFFYLTTFIQRRDRSINDSLRLHQRNQSTDLIPVLFFKLIFEIKT